VPYFPLESGVLTGKYKVGEDPPDGTRLAAWGERASAFLDEDRMLRVAAITEWAGSRGHTVLEAAMSWLVGDERVASVISGATKPEQATGNAAAGSWAMTADERADLDRVLGD
jgi:aryl-alcohol dehydrogenase-like predicted oxidoreductase